MAKIYRDGKKVSYAEMKRYTMKVRGWTSEEYTRKYHLFKNKLRAYESFKKAHGAEVKEQSPARLLYAQSKAMKREGKNYRPSSEMKAISKFSAVSITKGRLMAKAEKSVYNIRREKLYMKKVRERFKGLIEKNPRAKEMAENIKNPVSLEEALTDFANQMHAVETDTDGFAMGEVFGSDSIGLDFDYRGYME